MVRWHRGSRLAAEAIQQGDAALEQFRGSSVGMVYAAQ